MESYNDHRIHELDGKEYMDVNEKFQSKEAFDNEEEDMEMKMEENHECKQIPSTSFTIEFLILKKLMEKDLADTQSFINFFNSDSKSYTELFHALIWLEIYVQNLWEECNFRRINIELMHGMEDMLMDLKERLPFDDCDEPWVGGFDYAHAGNERSSMNNLKAAFYNIVLIISVSTMNDDFISEMLDNLMINLDSSFVFINMFIGNDTRLVTSLLAYFELEKSHTCLSNIKYNSIDLFTSLLVQWNEAKNVLIMELLDSELAMTPYLKRLFGFIRQKKCNGIKESIKKVMCIPRKAVVTSERPLFSRGYQGSSMKFNIYDCEGVTPVTITRRSHCNMSKENHVDVVGVHELNFGNFLLTLSTDLEDAIVNEDRNSYKALHQVVLDCSRWYFAEADSLK